MYQVLKYYWMGVNTIKKHHNKGHGIIYVTNNSQQIKLKEFQHKEKYFKYITLQSYQLHSEDS